MEMRIGWRRLRALICFGLAVALSLVSEYACGEQLVIKGECPSVSRDGRFLAFQRVENRRMHLGVLELANGNVRWVVRGTKAGCELENACHPAWGPSNELVFAYANITNTAAERFRGRALKSGYALCRWSDGRMEELIGGLSRNFSPSFSVDGRKVFFCRQDATCGGKVRICEIDAKDGKDLRTLVVQPLVGCGLSQPVMSPDGRWMAWAALRGLGRAWRVSLAELGKLDAPRDLTPVDLHAYAPHWLPDSRRLVMTGFRKGDPGWCVYLADVRGLSLRRLTTGRDACASPDGRCLYYVRDDSIYRMQVPQE